MTNIALEYKEDLPVEHLNGITIITDKLAFKPCNNAINDLVITTSPANALPTKLLNKNANNQIVYTTQRKTFTYAKNNDINRFILAAHEAYDHHLPIEISPDSIWLCLLQGFSQYINQQPETYRNKFVQHIGKETINISGDEYVLNSKTNNWATIVPQIQQQLINHVGINIYNIFCSPMSTSDSYDTTVALAALSKTTNTYFNYTMETNCHIKQYKILGDLSDWNKIKYRLNYFKQFGLEWWINLILPILNEIIAAIEGTRVNAKFWRSFYKHRYGDNTSLVHGWINVFFPYLIQNNKNLKNGLLFGWQITMELENTGNPIGYFHPGYTILDISWNYKGEIVPMEFISGFMAMSRDTDKTIRPEVGWLIRKK